MGSGRVCPDGSFPVPTAAVPPLAGQFLCTLAIGLWSSGVSFHERMLLRVVIVWIRFVNCRVVSRVVEVIVLPEPEFANVTPDKMRLYSLFSLFRLFLFLHFYEPTQQLLSRPDWRNRQYSGFNLFLGFQLAFDFFAFFAVSVLSLFSSAAKKPATPHVTWLCWQMPILWASQAFLYF